MLVIGDTSALIALATCDALPLLDALFDSVRVPQSVFDECVVEGKPHSEGLRDYLQNKIAPVHALERLPTSTGLGRGELEAMALYRELNADLLLVDDERARRIARLNGIQVVGSLGVLLTAKKVGRIPSIYHYIDLLDKSELYISRELIREALHLAGEAEGS